jgi:ribose transport system substrate-binding protein
MRRSRQAAGYHRRVVTIWGITAGALLLASCSSGSGPGSTPGAPAGTAISASALASLKAGLTRAEAVPTFTAPGPAVSASAVQGRTAMVMPVNSEIDACNTQAVDFEQLGQQLGMNVTYVSDQGIPTQWISGVQSAATSHAAAMTLLCGIAPQVVATQLQAAHAAGVAIVDGNYNDTAYYTGLDGETGVNTVQSITDDVDDAMVNLGGKPLHALVVSTDSIVQGPDAVAAVTAEEKRVCPGSCTALDQVIPIQDWTTDVQPDVHKALVANPDINAVIIIFDGMVQFAAPAVEDIHRPGLEIYTWGASRTVESYMLEKGSLIAADPGPDEQWDAYEAMDEVIRLLGGHPPAPVTTETSPDRFWVPGNVAQFFGPAGSYGNEGYGGTSFVNGFRQLWGLAPVSASGS